MSDRWQGAGPAAALTAANLRARKPGAAKVVSERQVRVGVYEIHPSAVHRKFHGALLHDDARRLSTFRRP